MSLYDRPLDLEAREIRLVRFQQDEATGSSGLQPTTLEMCILSLNGSLCFSALSYVWGDSADTVSITVNRSTFAATKNLHAALCHLSQADIEWIWIDALCIDMSNHPERTHQVSYMHAIYSLAHRVYLWLRTESFHTDVVMDYMAKSCTASGLHKNSNSYLSFPLPCAPQTRD
ncbi:heterokaryon incompatibility protein-domain-containing protein [Triangularia setosa]|uniref:Heterokaryon incompatibility protein-domain-containing protein n=1 Tax=Triangularia setosa TaxID=2587417 RepID=A0AAN6W0X5_9PEZI|nr:heterokaryon incompatibility protein-domain-containing protein [Podospora setosa]